MVSRKSTPSINDDMDPDPNVDGVLEKPGFKVPHVPDVDYLSTVPTFAAGLRQVRDCSKAHPTRVPIVVLVELKEDVVPLMPAKALKFTKELLDTVDAKIREVFENDQLITPDLVRGKAASLPEAIDKTGWPKLDVVRDKVMFRLDNTGPLAETDIDGHRALKGRAMFAPVDESDKSCLKALLASKSMKAHTARLATPIAGLLSSWP